VIVGGLAGLFNGLMITSLNIHPFIITLGTMAIYRGIAFIMTKAQTYTFFPNQFTDGLIRYQLGPNFYPLPMAIMLVVAVLGIIFLTKMVKGRYIYALGGNEQASRLSGIEVSKIKLLVYTVCGLTAGIAAMIMLGYYGSASSDVGKGYELDVIAASVVGGASLSGGRGSALGALLGAFIIQIINNSIIILGIDQNYSQVITGGLIILAVIFDQVSSRSRE
jgi:ribose transport system permease protein